MSDQLSQERPKASLAHDDVPPGAYWDDEVDLFAVWDAVMRRKWLVAAFTAVFGAIAVAYAVLAPPVFEARVIVMPVQEEEASGFSALSGQFGGLASLAGIDLGGGSGRSERALKYLESFAFLGDFIAQRNLLPVLFPDAWNAEAQEWRTDSAKVPSLQEGYKLFIDDILRVTSATDSSAITITVAWHDPETTAQWANALVAQLNERMRSEEVHEAQKSIDFLETKILETNIVGMQQTLYSLIESQARTVMLANVRDEYVFRVIDPAYVPEERSRPRLIPLVAVGILLGGMVGLFAVFAASVVDRYRARNQQPNRVADA